MIKRKRAALEAAGWQVGTPESLLAPPSVVTIRVTPAGPGKVKLAWIRPSTHTPLTKSPMEILAALKALAGIKAMGPALTQGAAMKIAEEAANQ